jgi:cold shock CspA family protein/ribosome-associated translation inhibitor RaiA
MQAAAQVTAHGVELTDAEHAAIEAHVEKLETFFDRVLGCRVTVSARNRRPQDGPVEYRVQILLTVPGGELAINRHFDTSLLDALQRAFRVAGRRLQDYARRLVAAEPPEARAAPGRAHVNRLFRWEGYGFLEDEEGREVYFHRNSVRGDGFDRLRVGTKVTFAEEEGDEGPQATTVQSSS